MPDIEISGNAISFSNDSARLVARANNTFTNTRTNGTSDLEITGLIGSLWPFLVSLIRTKETTLISTDNSPGYERMYTT